MMQTLTVTIPLRPTEEQEEMLHIYTTEYIDAVNVIAQCYWADYKTKNLLKRMLYKEVKKIIGTTHLTARIMDYAHREAYSKVRIARKAFRKEAMSRLGRLRIKKGKKWIPNPEMTLGDYKPFTDEEYDTLLPVLKRPICIWRDRHWGIKDEHLSLPFMIDGKATRMLFKTRLDDYQRNQLSDAKLGTVKVIPTRRGWRAFLAVSKEIPQNPIGDKTMGVDLGIKVPAVCYIPETGRARFFGNGRENRYVRRKYRARRRELQMEKKISVVKKIDNKEHRWMDTQNHRVSRQIVDFAIAKGVGTIKIGNLSGARDRMMFKGRGRSIKTKKHNRMISSWSYADLTDKIKYKAERVGVLAIEVSERLTTKTCPKCGTKNTPRDRRYVCKDCGFDTHRDIVGAMNIAAVEAVSRGNSADAQGAICSALGRGGFTPSARNE